MRLAPGDPLDRDTSVDGVPQSGIVRKDSNRRSRG